MTNTNLNKAKAVKNDEFFTQLSDIENELKYYTDHFKNKIIYCNCDNPKYSNFIKYFKDNYNRLQLKGLLISYLKPDGTGDFRSDESIELLKQADIVVSNPPFSLFREYVAQLIEYDKKFVIIGSQNAVAYKQIFKSMQDNKIWIGNCYNKGMKFKVPTNYISIDGYVRLGCVSWFTNLKTKKFEDIILTKLYNPKDYLKCDNCDILNVDKIKDIPMDYKGLMAVPVTVMNVYNPEQFKIIGRKGDCIINGSCKYTRIIIRNKRLEN